MANSKYFNHLFFKKILISQHYLNLHAIKHVIESDLKNLYVSAFKNIFFADSILRKLNDFVMLSFQASDGHQGKICFENFQKIIITLL